MRRIWLTFLALSIAVLLFAAWWWKNNETPLELLTDIGEAPAATGTMVFEGAEVLVIPLNQPKETLMQWFLNPEIANVGACTFHNERKFGMLGQYLRSAEGRDFWKIRLRVPEGDDITREFAYAGKPVVLYESTFERVEFRASRIISQTAPSPAEEHPDQR